MISSTIISQGEYLDYMQALDDLNLLYRCHKKGRLNRLENIQRHLQKCSGNSKGCISQEEWARLVRTEDPLALRCRIRLINEIHAKLLAGQKEQTAGEYLLAAHLYNKSLKVMRVWNNLFGTDVTGEDLIIQSPHALESTELKPVQITSKPLTESEKALNRYFELLDQNRRLKRTGPNNDHKKGAYEIFYDLKNIKEIESLTYTALYKRTGSHEQAAKGSMIGVVYEDPWCFILRDAVMSPHGKKHTSIRFYWKNQLDKSNPGSAAMMPIVKTSDGMKVGLILNYRHATQWEFELPRGGSLSNETPYQTAQRECEEETGYFIEKPIYVGNITPDSEILSSVIPIYRGLVVHKGTPKQEKMEAILGTYLFSLEEIKSALNKKDIHGNSYLEIDIEGEKWSFPVRDPCLIYALFQMQSLSEF